MQFKKTRLFVMVGCRNYHFSMIFHLSKGQVNILLILSIDIVNSFYPNIPFLYNLKTLENQRFSSDVFRRYGNETLS